MSEVKKFVKSDEDLLNSASSYPLVSRVIRGMIDRRSSGEQLVFDDDIEVVRSWVRRKNLFSLWYSFLAGVEQENFLDSELKRVNDKFEKANKELDKFDVAYSHSMEGQVAPGFGFQLEERILEFYDHHFNIKDNNNEKSSIFKIVEDIVQEYEKFMEYYISVERNESKYFPEIKKLFLKILAVKLNVMIARVSDDFRDLEKYSSFQRINDFFQQIQNMVSSNPVMLKVFQIQVEELLLSYISGIRNRVINTENDSSYDADEFFLILYRIESVLSKNSNLFTKEFIDKNLVFLSNIRDRNFKNKVKKSLENIISDMEDLFNEDPNDRRIKKLYAKAKRIIKENSLNEDKYNLHEFIEDDGVDDLYDGFINDESEDYYSDEDEEFNNDREVREVGIYNGYYDED